MAAPHLVGPSKDEDEAPAPKANVHDIPEGGDEQALHTRIAQLEENITELQNSLAAQEAATQRAVTSDDFMLSEVQRASEQLLCENSTYFSIEFCAVAWLTLWFSCTCSP